MKKKKVGIVGTHGVGKTTLAYSLAAAVKREGHNAKVVNEVVRRCPFPLNDGFSVDGATWTICEQVRRELDAEIEGCSMTICDRSALDPIFYLKSREIPPEEYEKLEEFAVQWLKTYDHLLWVQPSTHMPLLADGVRSTVPDFQSYVHDLFCGFFEEHPEISFVSISSVDVFNNNIEEILTPLRLSSNETTRS